jgi:hypothetical protein
MRVEIAFEGEDLVFAPQHDEFLQAQIVRSFVFAAACPAACSKHEPVQYRRSAP